MKLEVARAKLDRIINISRVEMYKPIQVAEILREFRMNSNISPSNLETFRGLSRELRNRASLELMGKVSTSSMRFQDDLWNETALPASSLEVLHFANKGSKVEEYIYQHIYAKSMQVIEIRKKLQFLNSDAGIEEIFEFFDQEGLRTSADRLFEVFALAVLQTQVVLSDFKYQVTGDLSSVLGNAGKKLISIAASQENILELAKMGHTNAADAGLDIWTNFGVVINVKNYTLNRELLLRVLSDTPIGILCIICKAVSLDLNDKFKIHLKNRPVVIITREELLKDTSVLLADRDSSSLFMEKFIHYFDREFPLATTLEAFMLNRNYIVAIPSTAEWHDIVDC